MSTLMFVESAITWLLVSTSPLAEMIMPVPAARPCVVVVVMFTMAGITLRAIAFASSGPAAVERPDPFELPPGVNGETGMVGAVTLCAGDRFSTATATSAPMPADARTSATAATAAAMRLPTENWGDGAGGPASGVPGGGPQPPPGGPGDGGLGGQLGGVWGGQAGGWAGHVSGFGRMGWVGSAGG